MSKPSSEHAGRSTTSPVQRHLRWLACAILVACTVGPPATAQDPSPSPDLTNLPGQIQLARLIDLAAEKLGLEVQYDPKLLQGATVTLRMQRGVDDQELWSLTNQLLATKGYTTVQSPGARVITLAKLAEAQGHARLEDGVDLARAGYVTLLVELEHQDPKTVIDAIRPLLSKPGGSIETLGTTGLLAISDARPRVEQALELIERLDGPIAEPAIETIDIQNIPANQLAGLINTATTALGSVTGAPLQGKIVPLPDGNAVVLIAPPAELPQWKSIIDRFDQRQSVQRRSYVPRHFPADQVAQLIETTVRDPSPRGSAGQWQVVSDDLTGTLIVTATPFEHEQIQSLLDRLDAVPAAARRPVRAFRIRNRNVSEVMEVLTRLLDAGVLEPPQLADEPDDAMARTMRQRNERDVMPAGGAEPVLPAQPDERQARVAARPPAVNSAGDEASGLILTADEGTNTLIAVGDARRLEQIEQMLEILDVRQAQVMLEVLLINITDGDLLSLGLELETMGVSGSTLFNIASLFGLGLDGVGVETDPFGEGLTGLVLNPGDFRVLVRALQTLNQSRTLNMPKVLVGNNQEAVLNSVEEEPFTSINASNTVSTTSFGGTQDAGTTVTVRPQIAEGDHLLLEYAVSLSIFTGTQTVPTLPPPRAKNNLESVVSIPDGYTVVVGGLEVEAESETTKQIPLLGDIPLLGELFKSRTIDKSRNRFYVFIRASILRQNNFEDLKYLSDEAKFAAEIDPDWPEVRPRVIP